MLASTQTAQLSFVKSITRAITLATVILAGAGIAQAADSNDRIIPPNPADVAILRGLLALQHPALRQGSPAILAPVSVVPTAGTEPVQQDGQTS